MVKTLCFNEKTGVLLLINQTKIPWQMSYYACHTVDDLITALQTMVVRGAPAIGVAAAFGCVLAAQEAAQKAEQDSDWRAFLTARCAQLSTARPTAVNLTWAVSRMMAYLEAKKPASPEEARKILLAEALRMEAQDITVCRAIGKHGAALLHEGDCVLTHCNAGALATVTYGTALGVIRAAHEQGKHIRVIADETRPLLQGARLTAQELLLDGIPVTVACDNACAALMQKGAVQCVVVGADRIAANGDTANKIGTLGVAILAHHFNIPFYVAAPISTIDLSTVDGSGIPIEERSREEVARINGTTILPDAVPVVNFAFDVTPAQFITGIITEVGVLVPPYVDHIAEACRTKG